ncbi:MAG: Ribosomal RNA large subunit methyltransferase H [Candidatus Magasanikbacteria bacterium GW2011_GWD2_43_18]|uniref:Ribosomal RNA large subunit methyltransferase H n=1 Tax=Candidatus Magasanikbacteria bacterium GW2011_GWE2_42_7 TaxID=1619052 RepID=A0A0G1BG00_9BACT|nr:MAG: Ribosomal RNA large subunit methyltransferase H [Candidatus Magasanikbacteria bacterium GW2011_GWC2_42_27]KKS72212.1 MAG: Ribosomal RNA large subunit methyltransferase H [Candidatus Magasanikbacteria bacterium GW2011_GWE2_42_7]KKT04937.1 MAG: Ribosomal RNA large subunit methyltransferase H [Candidatus Magasanikbacteria bacterium GW2011_GWD2_43_18]HBB37787.1 23S rRNA (pseudouridine(1915)-N(3))-methyltransferase RlmH [Candidatus Magasanikbacteria bacterium]HCC13182.1 23S rRNA (pseudouridi
MFNIQIITLGKLKETYWKDAEAEYLKRLSPYAKITFTELKEESFTSVNERESIQKKEAEKIVKVAADNSILIALHERGKEMTSPELATLLEKKTEQGLPVTFVIGGPLGLHESILEKANMQLSLSRLTFPHNMVRTILLEQIYRSVMIGKGKYHY